MRLALNFNAPEIEKMLAQRAPGLEICRVTRAGAADWRADVVLTPMSGSVELTELLGKCRGLRWLHVLGTGVDNFPFELAGGRLITCSRGATAVPIAEWVMAMMLTFEKQLPASWVTAPRAEWSKASLGTLDGRTLGLLGFGTIGREVATRAVAFGMRLLAKVRRHRPSPVAGVDFVQDLDAILRESDHLVLALPATRASRGMLGASNLSKLKTGVHLVNVARAGVLDQEALKVMLDAGHVAMASLDVVEAEPPPAGHWLYGHPQVRLSPHVSWSGPRVVEDMMAMFFCNLDAFGRGEPLEGRVDPSAGY